MNLLIVHPDVELRADDVDVRGGVPRRARVGAVRVAEGNVDPEEFLVLQDVADDVPQLDVRADGELADPVAVGIGVRVLPELALEPLLSLYASVSRLRTTRTVN